MPIKWIDEVSLEEFTDKKVLLRLDLNVPIDESGQITDASKIELSLPTIRYLLRAKALVIICSHLGRPKKKARKNLSLEPIALYLRDLLNNEVFFVHDSVGDGVIKLVNERRSGDLIFLENLRFNPGEEDNDPVFSKLLARLADIYVNDAFGVVHRSHASVDGVTQFFNNKCYGGLLLKKELTAFDKIIKNPKKPFLLIIGALKISTKIGMLFNLLKKIDYILIGGAMAYTFLKASGENVGLSIVDKENISVALNLLKIAKKLNVKVFLPVDHVVADSKRSQDSIRIIESNEFLPEEIGFDIGPKTIEIFSKAIKEAHTIFWNGPLGMFEDERFSSGTFSIAKAISEQNAYSCVGGGDSILAIKKANVIDKISFVSSGGGASLELLEGKELPGLGALGYYHA